MFCRNKYIHIKVQVSVSYTRDAWPFMNNINSNLSIPYVKFDKIFVQDLKVKANKEGSKSRGKQLVLCCDNGTLVLKNPALQSQ